MSDAAKSKATQKWAIEEPKLDNARRRNARRKLEIQMPAAMPCKTAVKCRGETCRNIGKHKTKYACIVDADEKKYRKDIIEDHIAAKGMNSLSHYDLVHKFIPMPQAY